MDENTFISQIELCAKIFDVRPGLLIKFFRLLLEKESYTTGELVHELELPRTHFGRILKFFEQYLKPKSRYVQLSTENRRVMSETLEIENVINKKEYIERLTVISSEIKRKRPEPKRELDQFLATPNTVINRVMYLHKHNEIYKRNILLLGDDDLTSIALSLLNNANKIQVVDIDSDILNLISEQSNKYNLNIDVFHADLRRDSLGSLNGNFDVVFTDPPYTTNGISLFLDRAIEALEQKNSSSIYFCYGNSSRATERTLSVQKMVLDKKIIFTSLEKNFNEYFGADSIGNSSSLYRCALTPLVKTSKLTIERERTYTHE